MTSTLQRPETSKKRGPIEIIEGKNVRVPIYDAGDGKVLLAYYADGKRKLVKCQNRETGRQRAKEIIQQLVKGSAHVRTISVKEAALLDFCMSALGPLAIPLSEAIREFVDAREGFEGGERICFVGGGFGFLHPGKPKATDSSKGIFRSGGGVS